MKKAFTLAEVLITLGIIGVVAALTMPSLITNYQKKAFATKLKQTYSILKNAEELSTIENGQSKDWNYNDASGSLNITDKAAWFDTYYAPYLKANKMSKSYLYSNSANIKNMLGANPYTSSSVSASTNPSYQLANGAIVTVWSNNQFLVFAVDLNGFQRPNVIGKDIFDFELYWRAPRSLTAGNMITDRSAAINSCKGTTYSGGAPGQCSNIIAQDGWEIKDDYPW